MGDNERRRGKFFAQCATKRAVRLKKQRTIVAAIAATVALAAGGIVPLETVMQVAGPAAMASSPAVPPRTVNSVAVDAENAAKALAAAGSAVQAGVTAAGAAVQQTIAPAPESYQIVTEGVREAFFSSKIPFGNVILREAKKNDVPPELVAAVIKQESKFQPHARSAAGAVGLMQLVPRTGHRMGASNLLDPAQNIAAGTKYLRYLSDEFNGNEKKVIAAYNAGDGNVRRFGGTPPFKETRKYVKNVLQYRNEIATQAAAATTAQPGL